MSANMYTQEQFDIALLKQQYSEINNSLIRIEGRFDKIDQQFEKVDREIKEVQKELKSEIRNNFFWTLGLIGTVFAVMAHGLKWF